MGAVVGMVLLAPAVIAFIADRLVQRRQFAALSARAVPYEPKPSKARDSLLFVFCALVSILIIGVLAVAAFASLVTLWPYNLTLSLKHYQFDLMDGGSWSAYTNSLEMALWTALVGTAVIFSGAYLAEKTKGFARTRSLVQLMAIIPLAVPGLVLGLSYIFFFNDPANPFHFLYGTMAILVVCTIVHFYTVAHLTAVTALKQIDPEFEAVSASLKVPFYKTFVRVTVPVCLPAILGISMYLFLNAMTTVSAVVFLYSPDTALASVAVLNMDDAGDIAPAAAMAMMIVYTSAGVRVLHAAATRGIARSTQKWRHAR
jgi:iron(III) transport system permease protein